MRARMSLNSGNKLGPYEIVAPLGAGGMGEVYRARDTRLRRDVAIKVLPSDLSSDPHVKARFEREARAISSLNHPHICCLYDIGSQDGTYFLVMELLEGETLGEQLKKGALPLRQVVEYGIQIAEALQGAHKNGIVHRDLKPGNIMLTRSGAKLLDFGLAKPTPSIVAAASTPMETLSESLTTEGTVVGTYQYMAPEQVEGKPADARSDIFALGAVLYEMGTGHHAFSGKHRLSVMSAILERDPEPMSTIEPRTPPALEHVVRTCMAKDPEQRWQSAGDVARAMQSIALNGSSVTGNRRVLPQRERLAWTLVVVLAVVIIVGAVRNWRPAPLPETFIIRSSIVAPPGSAFRFLGFESGFALSPDDRRLAYIAPVGEGRTALWVRSLDSPPGQPLPATEGATSPFWSPDSRVIGFFSGGKLKRVDVAGGLPLTVCAAPDARGGTWNRAGDILFGSHVDKPIYRVPAAGGMPVAVTRLDTARKERSHQWPYFLPDGRHFLYLGGDPYAPPESNINGIFVASLDSAKDKFLGKANSGAVYASGYLLFLLGTTLMAQPLDQQRLEVHGEPVSLAEEVQFDEFRLSGLFSVSPNGILAYAESSQGTGLQLEWFDRTGRRLGTIPDKSAYCCPQLSPDGSKVVYDAASGGKRDVWVYDSRRGTKTRLTFGAQNAGTAVWAPDAGHIIFSSNRNGQFGIYQRVSDGSGAEDTLLPVSEGAKFPWSWSRDGRFVTYFQLGPNTDAHLWILPLTGNHKPFRFAQGEFAETGGAFFPDGKWLTYWTDETGRDEVYAAAFPGPGSRYQISTNGGADVSLRRDGKEIFYISPDHKMMAAAVHEQGTSLEVSVPRALFDIYPYSLTPIYDVTPDGQRFIINTFDEQSPSPITMVSNWPALLNKK